jgi:hypothetical protein
MSSYASASARMFARYRASFGNFVLEFTARGNFAKQTNASVLRGLHQVIAQTERSPYLEETSALIADSSNRFPPAAPPSISHAASESWHHSPAVRSLRVCTITCFCGGMPILGLLISVPWSANTTNRELGKSCYATELCHLAQAFFATSSGARSTLAHQAISLP